MEVGCLNYSASSNDYNFDKYLLPVLLLRNLYSGNLTLEDSNLEQSVIAT